MSNKKVGNKLEVKVANILKQKGYWVHNFNSGITGQPVDLIAVRNDTAVLIEVKSNKSKRFRLSRIEDNQQTVIEYYTYLGNHHIYFAIEIEDEIYMIEGDKLLECRNIGILSVDKNYLEKHGRRLSEWR